MDSEMQPLPLDSDTADRLLAGRVAPEDAPPGYGLVVRLLEVASAEPSSEELAREPETVAAMAAALRTPVHRDADSPRRSSMPFALSRPRLTTAVVAAALATSVGMASAGSLPGAAQDVASEMLAKVGITVPGANENAGTQPDVRGNSTGVPSAPADAGKGAEISELATTTDLTGVAKGAAISSAASGGKSRAGQNGPASATTGAGVETPNSGGTGTADTASGGKSVTGTSKANSASGGSSSDGSGNASGGQETADTASDGRSSTGQSHRP